MGRHLGYTAQKQMGHPPGLLRFSKVARSGREAPRSERHRSRSATSKEVLRVWDRDSPVPQLLHHEPALSSRFGPGSPLRQLTGNPPRGVDQQLRRAGETRARCRRMADEPPMSGTSFIAGTVRPIHQTDRTHARIQERRRLHDVFLHLCCRLLVSPLCMQQSTPPPVATLEMSPHLCDAERIFFMQERCGCIPMLATSRGIRRTSSRRPMPAWLRGGGILSVALSGHGTQNA